MVVLDYVCKHIVLWYVLVADALPNIGHAWDWWLMIDDHQSLKHIISDIDVTIHKTELNALLNLSWCDGSSDRSFMVDPLSYFSFQPVLHDWSNKSCGMCYPVCGMVHIKEPLLSIEKSPCGSSGFPLSLSEWSFTICMTPYNRK